MATHSVKVESAGGGGIPAVPPAQATDPDFLAMKCHAQELMEYFHRRLGANGKFETTPNLPDYLRRSLELCQYFHKKGVIEEKLGITKIGGAATIRYTCLCGCSNAIIRYKNDVWVPTFDADKVEAGRADGLIEGVDDVQTLGNMQIHAQNLFEYFGDHKYVQNPPGDDEKKPFEYFGDHKHVQNPSEKDIARSAQSVCQWFQAKVRARTDVMLVGKPGAVAMVEYKCPCGTIKGFLQCGKYVDYIDDDIVRRSVASRCQSGYDSDSK